MKTKLFFAVLFAIMVVCPNGQATQSKALAVTKKPPEYQEREKIAEPDKVVIEDFKKYGNGKFPRAWRTWPFQRGKAGSVYRVRVEGDKHYLQASDDKDYSAQIMRPFLWDVEKYPYINWRMKPVTLPKGAMESDDNRNDSACGVYVIFGRYSGVATKYAWSTSLPVGQVVSRRSGNLKIQIVGSGQGGAGKWHSYSINVPQSYQKLFGKPMGRKPSGIAILTDGNATHTAAACDYADFVISKNRIY